MAALGMSTGEISKWGKRLLNHRGHNVFGGASGAEEMCALGPEDVWTGRCFVFNTADSDQPGVHWVALYFGPEEVVHFFDPFGRDITEFKDCWVGNIERLGRRHVYSRRVVQKKDSTLCGQHCLAYLLKRQLALATTPDSRLTEGQNDKSVFQCAVNKGIVPEDYNYKIPRANLFLH